VPTFTVRAGEELLVRDRDLPIAKIVPLDEAAIERTNGLWSRPDR
jgi:antitoxin (DNA-binding transcriptional repressor) of toxin-antitoxin stability system